MALATQEPFLLFFEEEETSASDESLSSPSPPTTKAIKTTASWNIKEKHKENHSTKLKKRLQQEKLQIETSDSLEIDLFDEEEAKENSEVAFLLANSRTNSNCSQSPMKRLPALKDLWVNKESVPLDTSMDSLNSPSASLVSLPEENENLFIAASKKNRKTPVTTHTHHKTILIDSQTESEEFPSWGNSLASLNSFPSLLDTPETKTNAKSKKIDQISSILSVSIGSDDQSSSERETSNSSEIQIFNTLPDFSEASSSTETQSEVGIKSQSKQKVNAQEPTTVVIASSSEESDSVSDLLVITPVPSVKVQCSPRAPRSPRSPTPSPQSPACAASRSPSSSPKRLSNRKSVLKDIAKRTSLSPKPKQKKAARTSSPQKRKKTKANSVVGRKRRRQEKTCSMNEIEPDVEHPAKRQRRATYSQRSKASRDDFSSSTEDSSQEIDSSASMSASPACSLKLSSELSRILHKKSQKKIFKGFTVLLTGVDGLAVHDSIQRTFSGCKELGDVIRRLIIAHGGQISSSFIPSSHHRSPHKTHPSLSSSILVSSEPKRTEKYLLGMVYGAPALSFQWIIDCCEEQILLDYECDELREKYQLPAGISTIDGTPKYLWEVLEDPDSFEYPPSIFDGLRCEVVGVTTYRNHWAKILRAAGAKVVNRLGSDWETEGRGLELVICEEPASDWVVRKCKKLEIPLCSSDFIVESILLRDIAPYDSFSIGTCE